MFERERTKPYVIRYALYLYFLGLSLRSTSRAIEPFANRRYVSVWYWIQQFDPKRIYPSKRERVSAFIIDETQIQIGYNQAWLWVAVEPVHRQILGVYISRHRNMLVTELFLKSLIKLYGKHTVYSDGGTWYPEACDSLDLKHKLHSPFEKSIIERAMEYVKDRTEIFDDYYPCIKKDCNLKHVYNWIGLFVFMYNTMRASIKFRLLIHLMGGDNA
jgi:putative transposase